MEALHCITASSTHGTPPRSTNVFCQSFSSARFCLSYTLKMPHHHKVPPALSYPSFLVGAFHTFLISHFVSVCLHLMSEVFVFYPLFLVSILPDMKETKVFLVLWRGSVTTYPLMLSLSFSMEVFLAFFFSFWGPSFLRCGAVSFYSMLTRPVLFLTKVLLLPTLTLYHLTIS